MSPKAHTKKVIAKAIRKKADSPFRCDNCGKTFVSESEKQAHENSQHADPRPKHSR
jgi:transposase-like protein